MSTADNIDTKGTESDGEAKESLSSLFTNGEKKQPPKKKKRHRHKPEKKDSQEKAFRGELLSFIVKILVLVCAFIAVFMFVFGVYRVTDDNMKQSIRQGDIVMYYRIDKNFNIDDIAVLQYEGNLTCGRVVARGGDIVDIDHNGLKVNGNYISEPDIMYETMPYVDGFSFPQTVPANSVFLLGDYRISAIDSRVYGTVSLDDIDGKVIAQFRRRGF